MFSSRVGKILKTGLDFLKNINVLKEKKRRKGNRKEGRWGENEKRKKKENQD